MRRDPESFMSIAGSIASIAGLALAAFVLFREKPNTLSGAAGFGFVIAGACATVVLVVNFWRVVCPSVEIFSSFKRYCERCSALVKKKPSFIFTIQSPSDCGVAGSDNPAGPAAFKNYLRVTARQLLRFDRLGIPRVPRLVPCEIQRRAGCLCGVLLRHRHDSW